MESHIDTIICANAKNVCRYVKEKKVDLSIVTPPYQKLADFQYYISEVRGKESSFKTKTTKTEKYLDLIGTIVEAISKVTKPGGICCLVVHDDIIKDGMTPVGAFVLDRILDFAHNSTSWAFHDNILWIKSTMDVAKSFGNINEGFLVDFHDIQFSHIYVLVKHGNNNFKTRYERISESKISDEKKQEIINDSWFVPPTSEGGFKDYLPKEIIIRLILSYSDEKSLILDPFAGDGITAVAAKILGRHFICFEKNPEKVKHAKTRLNSINYYK